MLLWAPVFEHALGACKLQIQACSAEPCIRCNIIWELSECSLLVIHVPVDIKQFLDISSRTKMAILHRVESKVAGAGQAYFNRWILQHDVPIFSASVHQERLVSVFSLWTIKVTRQRIGHVHFTWLNDLRVKFDGEPRLRYLWQCFETHPRCLGSRLRLLAEKVWFL